MSTTVDPRLNIAIDAARKAGSLIANAIDRLDKVKINEKAPNDFVTDIDVGAENIIIDTLKTAYPDHGFLAEESGEQQSGDTVWIIDPLDGTLNFVHGIPHLAVSIALQEKGKLTLGVVYDPIRNELFTACRGKGAKLNNVRMRISQCHQLENALLGTGFHQGNWSVFADTFNAFAAKCAGMRRMGAAALDLAYVASGRLDGFCELNLAAWDIAAGVLLVKEAGGLVGDVNGAETYLESGNIVAANPKLFRQMLQITKPHLG